MIVFYTVLFILMWKYRYVPLDTYEKWKQWKQMRESLEPGAGIRLEPGDTDTNEAYLLRRKPKHLYLVK